MKKLIILLFPFIAFTQINSNTFQYEFAKLLNAYRVQNHLTPVQVNVKLTQAAQIQSDYLASTVIVDSVGKIKSKIGHAHPKFNSPNDRLAEVDSNLASRSITSECVAMSYFTESSTSQDLAKDAFEMWKKSTDHNAILLSDINEIGVSISLTINKKTIKSPYGFDYDWTSRIFYSALVGVKYF